MDYFDSNFKDDRSGDRKELPEDFNWENMKDGIYEKMGESSGPSPRKYWGLLVLLLVSGCGGWFALDYFGGEKTEDEQVEQMAERIGETLDEKSSELSVNDSKSVIKDNSPESIEKPVLTEKASQNDIITQRQNDSAKNKTQFKNQEIKNENTSDKYVHLAPPANFNPPTDYASKNINGDKKAEIAEEKIDTPLMEVKEEVNILIDSEKVEEIIVAEAMVREDDKKETINAIVEEENISEENIEEEINKNKEQRKEFKKYLAVAIAGGINMWNAFDKTNVNHDFVSGFPGYTINPSVSFFVKPDQAIQLDYEYTFLQELFDYDGTHAIRVPVDSALVGQVVNSLTGQVISEDRQNIIADGTRYQRELKYNKYKLHALSLGYNYGKKISAKSILSLYLGASVLFSLDGKGKRLNEELDVSLYDQSNPIFGKTQLGIRLGVEYSIALSPKTSLMAQVITTKYITNWEFASSAAKTKPFLYGLQLGIRQRFLK